MVYNVAGIKLSNACGTDVTILDPQCATWSQANYHPFRLEATIIPVIQINSLGLPRATNK